MARCRSVLALQASPGRCYMDQDHPEERASHMASALARSFMMILFKAGKAPAEPLQGWNNRLFLGRLSSPREVGADIMPSSDLTPAGVVAAHVHPLIAGAWVSPGLPARSRSIPRGRSSCFGPLPLASVASAWACAGASISSFPPARLAMSRIRELASARRCVEILGQMLWQIPCVYALGAGNEP